MIILTGPTAVGKTKLSIALAKSVNGEIISADSMQVYRGMDIGSAKITREEMQGVPHHLIDVLDPTEDFNVVIFQRMCRECIREIYKRGHLPILVGGTGFYIQAVLREIDFTENQENSEYRKTLQTIAQTQGAEYLHERLRTVDPESADAIPAGNVKRVIRALEYYEMTGERISVHNARERERENAYDACYFVLTDDRDKLYARINQRVDRMLEEGLVAEVEKLRQMGCLRGQTAMQGLGYKEILDYLEGSLSLPDAVSRIKRDTRHFAKRQLTWFRREPDVIWVDRQSFSEEEQDAEILSFLLKKLSERGITAAGEMVK